MRILFKALFFLAAIPALGQIPTPQIGLSGNIGAQGFPVLNSGTLAVSSDANHTMTAQEVSATGGIKVVSAAAVVAYSISANILTLSAPNGLPTGGGTSITLSGFPTSTFLNGVTATTTSATSTTIVLPFTHANASATEKGLASFAWTAIRSLIMPSGNFQFIAMENATTGGFALNVCSVSASGPCTTIANGSTATVWYDGTSVVQGSGVPPSLAEIAALGPLLPASTGYVNSLSFTNSTNNTPNLRAQAACASLDGQTGVVLVPGSEVAGDILSGSGGNCIIMDERGDKTQAAISIFGNPTSDASAAGSSMFRVTVGAGPANGPCNQNGYCAFAAQMDDGNGRGAIFGFNPSLSLTHGGLGVGQETDIGVGTGGGYGFGQYIVSAGSALFGQIGVHVFGAVPVTWGWFDGVWIDSINNSAFVTGTSSNGSTLAQAVTPGADQFLINTPSGQTRFHRGNWISTGSGSGQEWSIATTIDPPSGGAPGQLLMTTTYTKSHAAGEQISWADNSFGFDAGFGVSRVAALYLGSLPEYTKRGLTQMDLMAAGEQSAGGIYNIMSVSTSLGASPSTIFFNDLGNGFSFQSESETESGTPYLTMGLVGGVAKVKVPSLSTAGYVTNASDGTLGTTATIPYSAISGAPNPAVANITSGTIDGAVIGGTTPAAITGTSVHSTGDTTAGGNMIATGNMTATAGTVAVGNSSSGIYTNYQYNGIFSNGITFNISGPDVRLTASQVSVGGGANTVYICSGGTFAYHLVTSSDACTGGTATATSLKIQ